MSRPLNRDRRLKEMLRKEMREERKQMPPPTITHKDKRNEKRQDVKKNLRREYANGEENLDVQVASELVKIAKELTGDFGGGSWDYQKNQKKKPSGKWDKFKDFMVEKVWHGPMLNPEHPDSDVDSKFKKKWKTGPQGGKYWEDEKGRKHYAGVLAMDRQRVARELVKIAKSLVSIEFPSQDALDKYLKEHPAADKGNHSVKKTFSLKKGGLHGRKLTTVGKMRFNSHFPVRTQRILKMLDEGNSVSMEDIRNVHDELDSIYMPEPWERKHSVSLRKKLKAILDSNR